VVFEQASPLGELHIRWAGSDEGDVEVEDEFDEPPPPVAGTAGDVPENDTAQESSDSDRTG
jgi:segregation and condensation protein A